MALSKEFNDLIEQQWTFFDSGWPTMTPATNHRSSYKQIGHMEEIKKILYKRLGAIPVYFFLVAIWPKHRYAGPYRELDKGLVILYHLVKGLSMEDMAPHIPKSSFHAIYAVFYKTEYSSHNKLISNCLGTMFSTIKIRLLSAKQNNPALFKHVTLHVDGHDTRAKYIGATTADMYSYKLKKSGLRTQVVMDCNGMAVFVSKCAPCRNFADGTMLLAMKMERKMHKLDCIAFDGGYPQFIPRLLDNTTLTPQNFAHPYRKKKGQSLTAEEVAYNATFGSFRSGMEALFGELGSTFEKHNNRKPVLVDKKETYNLQLKLCFLLLNIKKMVAMLKMHEEPIHTAWCRDGFEYPATDNDDVEQPLEYVEVSSLVEDGNAMAKLQQEFLGLDIGDEDTTMVTAAANKRKSNIVVEIPMRKNKNNQQKPPVEMDEDDDL